MEALVQTEQKRRELVAHGNLPNTSPAVKAFTNFQEREDSDLLTLITHQRTVITDEAIWDEEKKNCMTYVSSIKSLAKLLKIGSDSQSIFRR